MSSPSPGRYQSRLFNFLNRQTQRLKDQCDRAVRQVKVTTVWGVQIVLYPIYLLFQTGRLTGHQFQQTAQQKWWQLQGAKSSHLETPPEADTPIQRVLSFVDTQVEVAVNELQQLTPASEQPITGLADIALINPTSVLISPENASSDLSPLDQTQNSVRAGLADEFGVEIEQSLIKPAPTTQNFLPSAGKVIGGVASLLTTRTLVLVTVDNQIWDIFTPQQQEKLRQRITWEIADYWRQRRLSAGFERQFTGRVPMSSPKQLSSKDAGRSHLLPPVRLFWRVMAWVQTSPVAIAANLFQESTLVRSQELGERHQEIGVRINLSFITDPLEQSLTVLDRRVADLEAHPLQPVSEVTSVITHRTQGLLQRLQARFSQPIEQATPPPQSAAIDSPEIDNFKIYALIRAGVDYFFGGRGRQLPGNNSQSPQEIPGDIASKGNYLSGEQSTSLPPDVAFDPQLVASEEEEEDPWLTWGDLFAYPAAPTKGKRPEATPSKPPWKTIEGKREKPRNWIGSSPEVGTGDDSLSDLRSQLPGETRVTPSLPSHRNVPALNSLFSGIKRFLTPQQNNLERPQAAANSKLAEHQRSANSVTQSQRNLDASADFPATITPPSPDAPLDHTPDWIETQATPTGYVKHPLERLLEWLDRAMLWLEQMLVKIWRRLTSKN
ncbi:MAG: hypothetical protein KME08_13020 [Aphanothece sp. CMT-3BRIN-NPC111]|jgi:hypothetical protein|nr:hypothetical protein [Aphanothece sp. CMT-3BRIN-NPC111]